MKVRTVKGRKGDVICEVDGILCLFPRKLAQPSPDQDIDVMITHHPNPIWPNIPYNAPNELREKNPPTIGFLFVAPVTEDHFLVSHDGFECSGSMCRTTARVDKASDAEMHAKHGRTVGWLTPGRSPVVEVSNVDTSFYNKPRRVPVPGQAYVSMADLREGKNRVCGLPDLSQVDPRILGWLKRRAGSEVTA